MKLPSSFILDYIYRFFKYYWMMWNFIRIDIADRNVLTFELLDASSWAKHQLSLLKLVKMLKAKVQLNKTRFSIEYQYLIGSSGMKHAGGRECKYQYSDLSTSTQGRSGQIKLDLTPTCSNLALILRIVCGHLGEAF